MTMDASTDAISAAIGWLQAALLGTAATTIAIIAIASVGFLMLTGRIDVSRAARVIFGCFIIFGASTVARGIMAASSSPTAGPNLASASPPPPPQSHPNSNANATPYDPYAGAALPPR